MEEVLIMIIMIACRKEISLNFFFVYLFLKKIIFLILDYIITSI